MDRFEGWYYKMQAPEASLALIFAQHQQGSHKSASLQLTDGTVAASFALSALCARAGTPPVLLFPQGTAGGFGLKLHLETADCSFSCRFHFKNMIVPRSDVMGIFQYVPLLECRHSVFSLRHRVDGVYTLNGQCRQFENAAGYLEGDRGMSFPRRYLWTQCLFGGNLQHSVMLSVADIPFCGFSFTGTIACVWWEGCEYRLATYLGARVQRTDTSVQLTQGGLTLCAERLCENSILLRAPVLGAMCRTIRESLACTVHYRFVQHGTVLFDFISERASFEQEYVSPVSAGCV